MKSRILLISDDDLADRQLRVALSATQPECELHSAGTREAVQASPAPSVILLDLMLSRDLPFEMLRWLRADKMYKEVPVFVLGAQVIDRDVNEAYALGANGCLDKATTPDGLMKVAHGIAAYASLLGSPQSMASV